MDVLYKFKQQLIKIGIKKGDKIVLVLDFLKFYLFAKKNKEKIITDDLINIFVDLVGDTGTLVFNTFSWDFIKKKNLIINKQKVLEEVYQIDPYYAMILKEQNILFTLFQFMENIKKKCVK